jgi:hypothetical protein
MASFKERLLKHLELPSGERPDLAAEVGSALPLLLRERSRVFSIRLFGITFAILPH